jgi:hypothetical protein
VLLLPYTGLIQAVLIGLPAVFSLLALLQPGDDEAVLLSSDCESGRVRKHYTDGRCANVQQIGAASANLPYDLYYYVLDTQDLLQLSTSLAAASHVGLLLVAIRDGLRSGKCSYTPACLSFVLLPVCRVAVTAWVDERPSTQCEDWPLTTATPGVSGETGCKPLN